MKGILGALAAVACALLLVRVAVGWGYDTGVLVPPPEAAAENFLRALTEHRWTQARAHLAADLRRTPPSELAALENSLEEVLGFVKSVQGDDADVAGETATARASIEFSRARVDLHLPVRRENGLWKVASLDPLRRVAASR